MRNVSDKICKENENTHFVVNNFPPPSPLESCAIDEMKWKNILEPSRPQVTIWHMRIACWIPKATNTDSEYVILIALPLQQWLHERASVLRYTYVTCFIYCLVHLQKWTSCGPSSYIRWQNILECITSISVDRENYKVLAAKWDSHGVRNCVSPCLFISYGMVNNLHTNVTHSINI